MVSKYAEMPKAQSMDEVIKDSEVFDTVQSALKDLEVSLYLGYREDVLSNLETIRNVTDLAIYRIEKETTK